ncbi:MAG: hypothetical protein QOE86_4579 [Solirubrobacteraceae bacterium]|jgi:protein-disulfide isomerase|nr:hypothetical protein [Solirubrobacteraceae bacterium]
MSSRVEAKAAARDARLQAEAADAARVKRLRRVRVLVGLGLVALLVAVGAVAAGSSGSKTAALPKGTNVNTLFAGIPQNGLTLGKASAPATLEEFVDPQCPYCREFSLQAMPTLVKDYVRTGKLKLVLRPIAIIGPDSVTADRTLVATSLQNRAFPYLDLFYANQQTENSGYVNDAFLRQVGHGITGLDMAAAQKAATTDSQVTKTLDASGTRAKALGVSGTPTLFLTTGTSKPQQLTLDANDYAGSLSSALNQALGV